jgi:hypothetical protein
MKPEETNPTPAEDDPEVRFAKFMAEPMPPFVPRQKRRKALRIEVSKQMFEAVKANPNELRLTARDARGNSVKARPAQGFTMHVVEGPIRESEVGPEKYKQIREASRGAGEPDAYAPSTAQSWTAQRHWNGEVRYQPDDGRSNPNVTHVYDVFDVLKEDER